MSRMESAGCSGVRLVRPRAGQRSGIEGADPLGRGFFADNAYAAEALAESDWSGLLNTERGVTDVTLKHLDKCADVCDSGFWKGV